MAASIIDTPEGGARHLELEGLPAWRRPDWKVDPQSLLDARLAQLMGLASCLTVLGRADRTREVIDELIDDALPMLGSVMLDLSMDAIRAKDELMARRLTQPRGGLQ